MARTANLTTLATEMMNGSCLDSATFKRVNTATVETVEVAKSMGKVKILKATKNPIDTSEPTRDPVFYDVPMERDGKPFQGWMMNGADPIAFYGSEAAFKKLIAQG
jgi:hypothetical protein